MELLNQPIFYVSVCCGILFIWNIFLQVAANRNAEQHAKNRKSINEIQYVLKDGLIDELIEKCKKIEALLKSAQKNEEEISKVLKRCWQRLGELEQTELVQKIREIIRTIRLFRQALSDVSSNSRAVSELKASLQSIIDDIDDLERDLWHNEADDNNLARRVVKLETKVEELNKQQ